MRQCAQPQGQNLRHLRLTYEHKALQMEKYQRPIYDNVAIFVMIDA